MSNLTTASVGVIDNGPSIEETHAQLQKEGIAMPNTEPAPDQGNEPGALPSEGGEAPSGDRPEWLPEKFQSAEDMAKAYAELEKKQSQGNNPDAAQTEETNENEPVVSPESEAQREEASGILEKAGLSIDAVTEHYYANDKTLSEDHYKALAGQGISRQMVDMYISGLEKQNSDHAASVQAIETAAYEAAGSQDDYAAMQEWAGKNLEADEIDDLNSRLTSGNKVSVVKAVAELREKFEAGATIEPETTVTGKTSTTSSVYKSQNEMVADMNDPRYDNDPKFREMVMAKVARTQSKNG